MSSSKADARVPTATPSNVPTWTQSEVASSESAPQQIPPEQHGKVFSWADVKEIIDSNRLDLIRRKPSERLVYKSWSKGIVAAYGSITAYMCAERLRWTPLPSSCAESGPLFHVVNPIPFGHTEDFRILRNDWPYGSFEPDITHLIVWLKPRIPTDPETGLTTPESSQLIDAFVHSTFVKRLEQGSLNTDVPEKVMWFKNWGALQSVRGLEHIHVLVKDVPEKIVEEWTGETSLQA